MRILPKPERRNCGSCWCTFREVDLLDVYHQLEDPVQPEQSDIPDADFHLLSGHKGLLQTNTDGTTRLMDFLDEQRMCRLYEKFILEYYRKEFPKIQQMRLRFRGHWMTASAICFRLCRRISYVTPRRRS